MGKIISKTVVQNIYVSTDGRETPLELMEDPHLVNAFGQACQNDDEQLQKTLRNEIVRRLKLCK